MRPAPKIVRSTRSRLINLGFEALYASRAHLLMAPRLGGVGAILTLHHVRPPRVDAFQPNRLLEITPDYLRDVVTWLLSRDVDIVSLDEMHRRLLERDCERRFVCLTFDDGYRDNASIAAPILREFSVPFAIYIPTGFASRTTKMWWLVLETIIADNDRLEIDLGAGSESVICRTPAQKQALHQRLYWMLRRLPTEEEIHHFVDQLAVRYGIDQTSCCKDLCMDWDEIRHISSDPLVTIGAHTVNHRMLAKISADDVRQEMIEGRAIIEKETGRAVDHLAYPYGSADLAGPREFAIARSLGFKTAVTTRPGMLFAGHREHLTALPRISLNGDFQQIRFFEVLMSGAATALANRFRPINVG